MKNLLIAALTLASPEVIEVPTVLSPDNQCVAVVYSSNGVMAVGRSKSEDFRNCSSAQLSAIIECSDSGGDADGNQCGPWYMVRGGECVVVVLYTYHGPDGVELEDAAHGFGRTRQEATDQAVKLGATRSGTFITQRSGRYWCPP